MNERQQMTRLVTMKATDHQHNHGFTLRVSHGFVAPPLHLWIKATGKTTGGEREKSGSEPGAHCHGETLI